MAKKLIYGHMRIEKCTMHSYRQRRQLLPKSSKSELSAIRCIVQRGDNANNNLLCLQCDQWTSPFHWCDIGHLIQLFWNRLLGPSSSYIMVVHNDKKFEFPMALMKNNDSVLVFWGTYPYTAKFHSHFVLSQ